MDLTHKHWALIFVGGLVFIFVLLALWYAFLHRTPVVQAPITATSTLATTTPTNTGPKHLTENGTYYDIDLTYPASTPLASVSASADASAVAQMRKYAEDTFSQFKTDQNFAGLSHDDIQMMGLDQRKEALTSEYKTYTGRNTVSYVFTIYSDTLGAHPNTYFKTFTFDTQTGEEVSLDDLFQPSTSYLERISSRTRADLPGIITKIAGNPGVTEEIAMGTEPKIENFQNFYIDGKNLVFIFAPYQVGPYALGTITDPIPLAQLSDTLKSNYLP